MVTLPTWHIALLALGAGMAVGLVGLLLLMLKELLWLIYRATLQVRRMRAIVTAQSKKKPTLFWLLRAWRGEIFSFYTTLEILGHTLPWDPRQPEIEPRMTTIAHLGPGGEKVDG